MAKAKSDVTNLRLAAEGKKKILWADRDMPVLTQIRQRFEKQRPLRLLPRPEPVEALALLPDYPPARFRWRKVLHEVAQATGPERLSPEWWLRDPRLGEQAPRDYFRVEDREGRRYWLYRAEDAWFLQGLFA